jgi:hypothetical protein
MPIRDWNENGGFGPALADNLRSLAQARIEQLAKSRFGVLYWPGRHLALLNG